MLKEKIRSWPKSIVIHFTLLYIIFCVVLSFALSDNQKTRFEIHKLQSLGEDWQVNDVRLVNLPTEMSLERDKEYNLKRKLPKDLMDNMVLAITSDYCINYIFINDELRYSYGTKKPLPYGRMYGNIQCVVPVSAKDAGKTIVIRFIPQYTDVFSIPTLNYGSMGDFYGYIIQKNAWKLMICSVLFTFCVISFQMSVKQNRSRGRDNKVRMMQSYSLLSLFAIIWIICSSDLPQFFTSSNEAVSLTSYISLAFVGVPYTYFCSEIFKDGKKSFETLYYIGCANTVFVLTLFILNIADPPQFVITTHIYYVTILVFNVFYVIKERHTNPLIKKLRIAIVLLVSFAIVGLYMYYKHPELGLDVVAFGIGFTVFSALLFYINVSENEKVMNDIVRLDVYKELAYTDVLTQLGNRASFDNAIKFISENTNSEEELTLVMLDLNNLKTVNDNEGHMIGDEIIVAAASCISDAFQGIGRSFRIGGDEFSTLILGNDVDIKHYLAKLDDLVSQYNKPNSNKLSIAYGFATEKVYNLDEESIVKLIDEADQNMYINKKKMKILEL